MKEKSSIIKILFISLLIGVISGLAEFIFSKGLELVTSLRLRYYPYLFLLLPLVGSAYQIFFHKYGGESVNGMGQVFDVCLGKKDRVSLSQGFFQFLGTLVSHLFGASIGREGTAVQIGASLADSFSPLLDKKYQPIIIRAGIAAGFSGLFQTPLAAIFFSLELIRVGRMPYEALLPALIASLSSYFISSSLGLKRESFDVYPFPDFNPSILADIVLAGLIFGLAGLLFSLSHESVVKTFKKKAKKPLRDFFFSCLIISIIIYLLHGGRYAGSGSNLVEKSFTGEKIYPYDWILKLILTALCSGIGLLGGEVAPMFAIGASLGFSLSPIFNLPGEFLAAMGYVAVFSSASNTLISPIFLGCEIFGFENLPYFALVSMISYSCNFNKGIYVKQEISGIND